MFLDLFSEMKENYFAPLFEKMRNASNAEKAVGAKKYMKNQFEFLGIDSKKRKEIKSSFLKQHGTPDLPLLKDVILELWNRPEREYQYIAIEILQKLTNKLQEEDIEWIEQLITIKSWWDTVDGLSSWICDSYFQLYPDKIKPVSENWILSGNIWLQRSALLFQLKYKGKTDSVLLAKYIGQLTGSREFFINKAIGWMLREYSKSNKEWVKGFVSSHSLAPLSYREATKYL
jgi:3-methyladenine DNA glycosylase AlkD